MKRNEAGLTFSRAADGRCRISHDWPHDFAACRAIQTALAPYVVTRNHLPERIERVAGVDVGFEDNGKTTRAAVVVLDPVDLSMLETRLVHRPTRMPYIPGMLSFREVPAALDALAELAVPPDLLLVDGHGIVHPRRIGSASHLGLASGLPSIGVAKKKFIGEHGPVPDKHLAWTPLTVEGKILGAALRSRAHVKPIFISPGHRVDLKGAIHWVVRCLTRYRLPETTRMADRLASGKAGSQEQLKMR